MASVYLLVPLAIGPLAQYDLTTRAVLGAIWDRYRLSSYNVTGGDMRFYDFEIDEVYAVYDQSELARILGVSLRTVQRSIRLLKEDGVIWTHKAGLQSACRFYLHQSIRDYLRANQTRQSDVTTPPNCRNSPDNVTQLPKTESISIS